MSRFSLTVLCALICWAPAAAPQDGTERVCFTADKALAAQISKYKANQPNCQPGRRGCGSSGGPGYRNFTTAQCVGWQQLNDACGPPPHNDCFAECLRPAGTCTLPETLRDQLLSEATPNRLPDDLEDKPARETPIR